MAQEKASSKKVIFWLFLVVFIWLAITHFAETKKIFTVLQTGKWYWVVAALISQLIFYPVYAKFVDYVFRIFQIKMGWRKILPVTIAAKFTDVALPVATFGTVAIFLRNSKKENQPALNTGIAISFVLMYEVLAFTILALLGFITLFAMNEVPAYMSVTFYILLAGVALALYLIVKLAKDKTPPSRFFLWVIHLVARMAGKKQVSIEEIEKIFLEIGADVKRNRKKILPALYRAIFTHAINLATLGFVFLAFAGHFNPLAIVTTYIGALLFTIVSITPQGVGVVETVMITSLRAYGIDLSVAAVITFTFRSLLYWLPVFAGFYYFSKLELKTSDPDLKPSNI